MTTPAAAPRPVTLDDFFNRVRERNPFTDNRISGPSPDDVDVDTLHQAAFERLLALADEAVRTRRGLGVVVWGEAGIGKSHLLSRLGRWAAVDERACLVYLHNLQASPAGLPRVLLRAVVNGLSWTEGHAFNTTRLVRLIHAALRSTLGGQTGFQSWGNLQRGLLAALEHHSPDGPADATLADRTVHGILFRFYKSVMRAAQGKEDGAAAVLALQWLKGDALSPDQGRLLGLPPARHKDDPVALEDVQQVKQVLVALTALAACRNQPFVLCFDQVDNLDAEQFSALGRFLEALIDSAKNLLVVTAGIESSLRDWHERRVVQESAWDRLAQFKLSLERVRPGEARPLVEQRLGRALEPFDELSQVRQLAFEDPLFPLGSRWFEERTRDRDEVRPRDVLNEAREAWYHEQQVLAREGGASWLAGWKLRHAGDEDEAPPSPTITAPVHMTEGLEDAINRTVEEKMDEYKRAASVAVPDPDSVTESVAQLLEQCRKDGSYGVLGVERVERTKAGLPPAYNLLVRQRGPVAGTVVRTGLVFVPATNAYAMFHVLDRLLEDRSPPQRILLVADEHGPDLGTKGGENLEALRQRPGTEVRVLQLPVSDFATLDALHAVWNMARGEDLELVLPGGKPRPVRPEEVEASHHRRGRYRAAPILSTVLTVPATTVALRATDTIVTQVPVLPLTQEEIAFSDDLLDDE